MLHVGARGERWAVRGRGWKGRREWAVGRGEGESRQSKRKTCDKDDVLRL